jgi:hypothetical protein
VDYCGLSERAVVRAVEHLTADGKYELAASLLDSSRARFERSDSMARAERLVHLKLMEKHQNSDPFKFIILRRESRRAGAPDVGPDRTKVMPTAGRIDACPAPATRRAFSRSGAHERSVTEDLQDRPDVRAQ